jgi:acetyl-CoA C-acetyltransferase
VGINEAFAAVPMAAMTELKIPHDIASTSTARLRAGPPIGASGARIIVTLIYALKRKERKKGIATLRIGGGEGTAMAIELL